MLQWNILQYLTTILRQYFKCNERLEIFLTCFCNILCYVGRVLEIERVSYKEQYVSWINKIWRKMSAIMRLLAKSMSRGMWIFKNQMMDHGRIVSWVIFKNFIIFTWSPEKVMNIFYVKTSLAGKNKNWKMLLKSVMALLEKVKNWKLSSKSATILLGFRTIRAWKQESYGNLITIS